MGSFSAGSFSVAAFSAGAFSFNSIGVIHNVALVDDSQALDASHSQVISLAAVHDFSIGSDVSLGLSSFHVFAPFEAAAAMAVSASQMDAFAIGNGFAVGVDLSFGAASISAVAASEIDVDDSALALLHVFAGSLEPALLVDDRFGAIYKAANALEVISASAIESTVALLSARIDEMVSAQDVLLAAATFFAFTANGLLPLDIGAAARSLEADGHAIAELIDVFDNVRGVTAFSGEAGITFDVAGGSVVVTVLVRSEISASDVVIGGVSGYPSISESLASFEISFAVTIGKSATFERAYLLKRKARGFVVNAEINNRSFVLSTKGRDI